MASRPRVGVTGNSRRWAPSWWCAALALRLVGAVPERITVRHPPSGKPLHALIISGGNDIGPEHYGGDINAKIKVDPARDKLEMRWIQQALADGLPLLGICRGAQLINVVMGGTLHQDIRSIRVHTHNHPGLLPTKRVYLKSHSLVARICKHTKLRVNSLHHQAVKQAGDGLQEVGLDRDAIVQAIESTSERRVIGVQWHPEYLFYLPSQLALFRWLLSPNTADDEQ
ncbi:gamma-glutamyl-gamma-aminobutyrate hydrolase family protein [Aestuariicella hydrocarbonica]|uniref:Gamma-glutamyl-gamma-aminobutyrate hydrolase family protein n=1 Tax=Pseudomaricurvus hydrocarbonicus TaxID=1470433 RepID=A0A9E5MKB1_9GAMM|nr:gamma-glutamyl-gamma-aminobutyrate hydrolase family protein [Aestuariicella hydrocarbonica]NHO66264.1 gamma-glutamyl-gamma-aminobutyrate hydrolase family protein [Aestuariicella hydrocarbonica]